MWSMLPLLFDYSQQNYSLNLILILDPLESWGDMVFRFLHSHFGLANQYYCNTFNSKVLPSILHSQNTISDSENLIN